MDVLTWIGRGCPERDWPDFTYKTSALALQSRGLARVSKSGGVWSAQITDAGRRLLAGEAYEIVRPPRDKAAKKTPRPVGRTSRPTDADKRRRRAMATALLKRLEEHGGSLEIAEPSEQERAEVRQGVSALEATGMTPRGRVLRFTGTRRGPLRIWLTTPPAHAMPISPRQYDVMAWVQEGLPELGADATAYRAAARQLHNRGLLRVAGRGASLTATVTDLGRQAMVRQKKQVEWQRQQEQQRAEHAAQRRREEDQRLALGVELIAELAAAGGRLDLGNRYERRQLSGIVGPLRNNRDLPQGQRLEYEPTMMDERLGYTIYFAPNFRDQIKPATVLVPSQLRQPSGAVSAFRSRRRRVTKESIPRAARILQAIIDGAHERDWTAGAFDRGYTIQGQPADEFDLTIDAGDMRRHVIIRERNGNKTRERRAYVPTYWDSYRDIRPADSKMVRNRAFAATGDLILEVHQGDAHQSSVTGRWEDGRGKTVEVQLTDLFYELDVALAEKQWSKTEHDRRRGLARERWEQVRAEATEELRYAKRAEQLADELDRWAAARRMRAYADSLEAQAARLDPHQSDDLRGWIAWIRAHATTTDPANGRGPRMTTPDRYTDQELQPYLHGWTPYGPPGRSGW
ncbi:hypothetical protein [Isoptericola aurantiacus]|uniref:hypothetical protein n=1 Tax=Isoptericola aurantiacus TaxID=3377839 RepID=UPI00383B9992